jgi:hypothetical protein
MHRWIRMIAAVLLTDCLLLLGAGSAIALQVGDKAPDFALPATVTDKISLADYLGKNHIVVFFYIAAFGRA